MKNKITLLSNLEIYKLSKYMTFAALVAKVHQTQPGLTRARIREIVKAQARQAK